jgi:hypothetical protein
VWLSCNASNTGRLFSFPRENAESQQQRRGEGGVLDALQRTPHLSVRRISIMAGAAATEGKFRKPTAFVRNSSREYTFYQKMTNP